MASYEVRQIHGKGQGILATRHIPLGSVILTDKAILTVAAPPTDRAIEAAFQRLSKRDQDTYLSLYQGRPDHTFGSSAVRIFHSNAFDSGYNTKVILPLISRINHSCVPNAEVLDRNVYAQQDISPGEEIHICYKEEWDEVLTASQRNFLFKRRYGFQCRCKACLPTKHRWLSDRRRLLIGAVRFSLEGGRPADLEQIISADWRHLIDDKELRKAHWPPKIPSVKPARTSTQKIEYTFLLARLREAEGISSVRVATAFSDAADLLMGLQNQYMAMTHRVVFFPESFRCYEEWMKEAIYHSTRAQGPSSKDTKMYKESLHAAQTNPVLMGMSGLLKSNGGQQKKCWAISMDPQMRSMPEFLTLRESEECFSKQRP